MIWGYPYFRKPSNGDWDLEFVHWSFDGSEKDMVIENTMKNADLMGVDTDFMWIQC